MLDIVETFISFLLGRSVPQYVLKVFMYFSCHGLGDQISNHPRDAMVYVLLTRLLNVAIDELCRRHCVLPNKY